jgi:hypothetical protein
MKRQYCRSTAGLPHPEAAGLPDTACAGLVSGLMQQRAAHDERHLVNKQQ